jgi:hypothetical protein
MAWPSPCFPGDHARASPKVKVKRYFLRDCLGEREELDGVAQAFKLNLSLNGCSHPEDFAQR